MRPPLARALLLTAALLLAACVQPVSTPTATPAVQPGAQTITLESPPPGATITSPLALRGATAAMPLDGRLTYRIFDSQGSMVGGGSLPVTVRESGGHFDATVTYQAPQPGQGRIEVLEINPADGSIRAAAAATVVLSAERPAEPTLVAATAPPAPTLAVATLAASGPTPPPTPGQAVTIESPAAGTLVGSPLTVVGRTSSAPQGGLLSYRVRDSAGQQIGAGQFPAQPLPGGGASFTASLTFTEPPGGGAITVDVGQAGGATASVVLTVAPKQAITIESPAAGTLVGSPLTITGRTARFPFQGALAYRVLDAAGQTLGAGLVGVDGGPGLPGEFVAELNFTLPQAGGDIRVELTDQDAASGVVAARQTLALRVAPQPGSTPAPTATPGAAAPTPTPPPGQPAAATITIESPAGGSQVSGQLTVVGRTTSAPAGGQLRYRVRDATGRTLGEGSIPVVAAAGQPASFSGTVAFTLPDRDGPIALEVLDVDAAGAARSSALVILQLARPSPYPAP